MSAAAYLRELATEARADGRKASADILKRMARDVDAGRESDVRDELEQIAFDHRRGRDATAEMWQCALRAVSPSMYEEPPAPPVYVTMRDHGRRVAWNGGKEGT